MAKKTPIKNAVKKLTSTIKLRKTTKKTSTAKTEKKVALKKVAAKPIVAAKKKKEIEKVAPKGAIKKIAETIARITKPKEKIFRKASSLESLITKVSIEEKPQEERKIEESKFDIGVARNAEAIPVFEIPFEYHVDRAVVLTVDPRFVFAYWEVKPESIQRAQSSLGQNARLTLRFYDISGGQDPDASPSWDIEIFDRLGNWYLRLDHPEQLLCLDVGMKNDSGNFYRIARSNVIKLPRQSLAAPGPLKWMVVSPDGQKIITEVEEYTDADLELLRKILGPYFFDLLMKGQFASIAGSSLEAIFQEIAAFRLPMEISSSPSSWSRHP